MFHANQQILSLVVFLIIVLILIKRDNTTKSRCLSYTNIDVEKYINQINAKKAELQARLDRLNKLGPITRELKKLFKHNMNKIEEFTNTEELSEDKKVEIETAVDLMEDNVTLEEAKVVAKNAETKEEAMASKELIDTVETSMDAKIVADQLVKTIKNNTEPNTELDKELNEELAKIVILIPAIKLKKGQVPEEMLKLYKKDQDAFNKESNKILIKADI